MTIRSLRTFNSTATWHDTTMDLDDIYIVKPPDKEVARKWFRRVETWKCEGQWTGLHATYGFGSDITAEQTDELDLIHKGWIADAFGPGTGGEGLRWSGTPIGGNGGGTFELTLFSGRWEASQLDANGDVVPRVLTPRPVQRIRVLAETAAYEICGDFRANLTGQDESISWRSDKTEVLGWPDNDPVIFPATLDGVPLTAYIPFGVTASASDHITITPLRYWSYGGIYNTTTGAINPGRHPLENS